MSVWAVGFGLTLGLVSDPCLKQMQQLVNQGRFRLIEIDPLERPKAQIFSEEIPSTTIHPDKRGQPFMKKERVS